MFVHEIEIRVRYGETDKMGYLYYGHYAEYLEVARVEAIRSLGISYKEMEDEIGIMLPVLEFNSKYLRPAYYDDVVILKSRVEALPDKFITFSTDFINKSTGKLMNKSVVKLGFVSSKSRKLVDCPEVLMTALKTFF